jgi:PAS domain S-box-containing protein
MRRQQAPSLESAGFDPHVVFRSIFAAYPDAMLLVDGAGTIMIANPAAETLLGYSADELAGMSVDQLVPARRRPAHAAHREAYGRSPQARPMGSEIDLVARRKDGREVPVEIALSPLRDHGLPFVVASIRDVGNYPRVTKALQRARYSEHLASMGRLAVDERDPAVLLERAPRLAAEALHMEIALACLLEKDGQAFRVTSGIGLLPWQQVGTRVQNTPDTLPGYLLEHAGPVVLADYRDETRFALPGHLVDAGLRSGIVLPLSDRGRMLGALIVHSRRPQAFGKDEIRFLESLCSLLATSLQRADAEEALNHAQRLESVGQLTGGIAHDFNNLLTVIQGNLQFIGEAPQIASHASLEAMVGAAARATRRAAELTAKLLAFSRRQMLQPAAVHPGAMLTSLAELLRRTLDQRIAIVVDVQADCPAVFADPVQLESAVLNIAINARDAMPDGGSLTMRAAKVERGPQAAGDDPDQTLVSIAISDTGKGMTDEVRERAFEPFFTTKAPGRGTGLGLSTVYGFVKQSHGTVAITSWPDAGTTVTLHLPQHRAAVAPPGEERPEPGSLPRGLRVLLVEDDPAVLRVARRYLGDIGTEVIGCATAEEALGLLVPDMPWFDLLLTDIALGTGMRGTELALEAQRRLPGLAVMLVSGYSAELIDADRSAPPEWQFLSKPYSRSELVRAMAEALRAAPPRA